MNAKQKHKSVKDHGGNEMKYQNLHRFGGIRKISFTYIKGRNRI